MAKQSMSMDDSIEKIIEQYSDMVYRPAFARTGTKHDADDIYQEVFIRYVKNKPIFVDEIHQKAWLLRVTVNCSNTFFTSSWRTKIQQLSNNVTVEEKEPLDLESELKKLPLKYRDVIHLFYYEELSTKEIAHILGRKESTVRMQLTRSRGLLKDFMKEEDYV